MYDVLNMFRNNNGVIEITSNTKDILNGTVTHIRETLGVSNNKVELKIIRAKLLSIKLSALEADSYGVFWGILEYILDQGWEPYGMTADTLAFRILRENVDVLEELK